MQILHTRRNLTEVCGFPQSHEGTDNHLIISYNHNPYKMHITPICRYFLKSITTMFVYAKGTDLGI